MMEDFLQPGRKIFILNGGMGSLMTDMGHSVEGDPLWSARLLIKSPEVVTQVYRRFLEAGSNVIESNSYQASLEGVEKYAGLSNAEAKDLLRYSVHLARDAAEQYKLDHPENPDEPIGVAGSIGPYGIVIHDGSEYNGCYLNIAENETKIKSYYHGQIEELMPSVDCLKFDTIPALSEVQMIGQVISEMDNFNKFYWISVSCKDDSSTNFGDPIEIVAQLIQNLPHQPAMGINCTAPHLVTGLIRRIRVVAERLPLVIYPNKGEDWTPGIGFKRDDSLRPVSSYVDEWLSFGNIVGVGGCCRVDPAEIGRIAEKIRRWEAMRM